MSRYKEALENIVKSSCPEHTVCKDCYMNLMCAKQAKEWVDTLYEVVEKENPKIPADMPKYGICPQCGSFVVQICEGARCVMCGQRLKWSDDDE